MAASDELTKVFLASCDEGAHGVVQNFISKLQSTSARVSVKTFNNLSEVKGSDLAAKLQNLSKWATAILIISSENLASYIDKKDSSKCPDIIKNDKSFQKALKILIEKESKSHPNKLLVVSLDGGHDMPKCMKGMDIIEYSSDGDGSVNRIISEIEGK